MLVWLLQIDQWLAVSLLLFIRDILLRSWPLCEQTWFTSSRHSASLHNEIVAYSCIEKVIYFGFLFRLGLQTKGISYFMTICKIFRSSASFFQLSKKCTNFLDSGAVGIFRLRNNSFTNVCTDDNFFSDMSCGFFFRKVAVLVSWVS